MNLSPKDQPSFKSNWLDTTALKGSQPKFKTVVF